MSLEFKDDDAFLAEIIDELDSIDDAEALLKTTLKEEVDEVRFTALLSELKRAHQAKSLLGELSTPKAPSTLFMKVMRRIRRRRRARHDIMRDHVRASYEVFAAIAVVTLLSCWILMISYERLHQSRLEGPLIDLTPPPQEAPPQ